MQKPIFHDQIDERLEPAADRPECFEAIVFALIEHLDEEDADLEITDPSIWRRRAGTAPKTTFVEQFWADVDAILPLDRRAEARLARRIEFARLRLEKAQREQATAESRARAFGSDASSLPRRLDRRSVELQALRTEMVERNLYLVLINVERYGRTGASRLDLIQEGCVSLFRAVDGFNWRRGLLFRTYAVHWLNQAFRNYLYNNSRTVRVPVYLQKAMRHVCRAIDRLGDPHARAEEIAAQAHMDESLVTAALFATRSSLSIDAEGPSGEDGMRLRDAMVDSRTPSLYDPRMEDVTLEGSLGRAMAELNQRERLVLSQRYGLDGGSERTLAELAARLQISVERVRQIQMRALAKMNTPTLRRELDPYLN